MLVCISNMHLKNLHLDAQTQQFLGHISLNKDFSYPIFTYPRYRKLTKNITCIDILQIFVFSNTQRNFFTLGLVKTLKEMI